MIILFCECQYLINAYFLINTQTKEPVIPLFRASTAPRSPTRAIYHIELTLRPSVWQEVQNNLRLAWRQDGSLWTIGSAVSPFTVSCLSSSKIKCQFSVLKMRVQTRKLFFLRKVPSETVSICLTANSSDGTRNTPANDIAVSNLLTN
jgi:hypothetical protein